METLRADAVHASASMHSTLSCIRDEDVNDLTREKEEELLYGTGEDGDEEEALSDDSLRLRLSDDEAESDAATLQTLPRIQLDKPTTGKTDLVSKDPQQSDDRQKQCSRSSTPAVKSTDDEEEPGNISVNEKVKNDQDTYDTSEGSSVASESSKSNSAWQKINVSRWRFADSPRTRSFSHNSRALPSRNCYSMYSENNRSKSDNYNGRVKGGYTRGKRGRPRIHTYAEPTEKKDKRCKTKPANSCASAGNINSSQEVNLVALNNSGQQSALNNMKLDNDKENDRDKDKVMGKKLVTPAVPETQVGASDESSTTKNVNLNTKLDSKKSVEDVLKSGKSSTDSVYIDKTRTDNSLSDVCNVYDLDKLLHKETTLHANVQSEIHKKKQTNVDIEKEDSDKVERTLKKQKNSIKENDNSNNEESLKKKFLNENIKSNRKSEECMGNKASTPMEELKMKEVDANSSISDYKENDSLLVTENDNRKLTKTKSDNHLESLPRKRLTSPTILPPEKRYNNNTDDKDTTSSHKQEDKISKNQDDKKATDPNVLGNIISDIVITKTDVNENSKEPSVERKSEDGKATFVTSANDNKVSTCKLDSLKSEVTDNKISPNVKGNDAEVVTVVQRRRRRTKKIMLAAQEAAAAFSEEKQGRENGRQKRKTAKNAEEIIRKKFLNHDSDAESSDNSDKFIIVNHKISHDARSISPPSLKRNYSETEASVMNGCVKKMKSHSEALKDEVPSIQNDNDVKNLNFVHKFFQRDLKEKLPKLKQEDLEELLIQKVVETITMRGEIGKLREQARISERNQEATRARCQQLAKQIKDFEMVLKRNAEDQRANNGKPIAPIKINRSVGLQVNFTTEHGMQNLRQLQQTTNLKALMANGVSSSTNETNTTSTSPRRGIKVRSPRRLEPAVSQSPVITQTQIQPPPLVSTVTPAALVVAKPFEQQHTLTVPATVTNTSQLLPNQQQAQQSAQQAIVINGKLPSQPPRSNATITITKGKPNDPIIDLTDEEEKSKTNVAVVTTSAEVTIAPKPPPCFQRVIPIPGNVAISGQSASIRLVQPTSQPTPTALVNNMNSRVAYVMQSGVGGSTRQLIITSSSNQQMRPVTSGSRTPFSTVTYKTGISTIANGTVRVLTTPAGQNVQVPKFQHPAPLPDTPVYGIHPVWKLPPPAPSLKISKVANGIVLSWNMSLTDKYADIASYQLYAYQEVSGVSPNTALWKKVGDVRALPLPMACTLTQFSEGNNYYFAVRAVDTHSRKGQYSAPGNISL